ncbi:glycogen debranching N-terminal domain-containing protein [Frateuria hangzhouensis]|uniref:amylo-alpha-1,6-glucosidase n=1 Tax=Frateuria hangzhouensis TaxID=2995589 RepID=UPI002260C460|nr:glycogen debranching N-terminal domain-containing protein [Frateuria sp. STR12]MCX7513974.1 amylo-alpha-1,6-glucosidase [Frateuria sp. STR12]
MSEATRDDETPSAGTSRGQYSLKFGDTFVVCDAYGDIRGDASGLFHNDTRMLSVFTLDLGGKPPSLLSAAISHDNVLFTANLSNKPLPPMGERATPQGVIHLQRTRFLWDGRLYERISCVNYDDTEVRVTLTLRFGADFRDIFEVRGTPRKRRGHTHAPCLGDDAVVLRYDGLDGVMRCSVVSLSAHPDRLEGDCAELGLTLPRLSDTELYVEVGPDHARPSRERFRAAAARARWAMRRRSGHGARPRSNARLFNAWLERSRADIALLVSEFPTGPYPCAGIPWFATPFGRDGIITALQLLWLDASLARGVLGYLAEHQAHETSAFRDSAPGKIMHETRKSEMADLGEVPFGRYYGGVDTTPLYVMLAGAYAERTGDDVFVDKLWPALTAAMGWIERTCDKDPHGFLSYAQGEKGGLLNQGWKDSEDSVFHADGTIPPAPIALVEVQGYVYAALIAMARLAERRGDDESSAAWRHRALVMRKKVEALFWDEELGNYGIARDGNDALCCVRASNAGHLLYVGLPKLWRAKKVIRQFRSAPFDSGWGVRTLAMQQARFNPMSYHDGSVWPHDVALCAAGMAHYGEREDAVRLLGETFEAAVHFGMRLPELFCGFARATGEPPIAYPVACLPQAWAAGSVFMMLQACLGLTVDGRRGEVRIDRPHLPDGVDRLTLHKLDVGGDTIDLGFERIGSRTVAFRAGGSVDVRIIAKV